MPGFLDRSSIKSVGARLPYLVLPAPASASAPRFAGSVLVEPAKAAKCRSTLTDAAKSPRPAAAAAAAPAASYAYSDSEAASASTPAASAACATGSAAPAYSAASASASAAAAASLGKLDVALNRLAALIIEDVEGRQADVGDLFLAESDFVKRSGAP